MGKKKKSHDEMSLEELLGESTMDWRLGKKEAYIPEIQPDPEKNSGFALHRKVGPKYMVPLDDYEIEHALKNPEWFFKNKVAKRFDIGRAFSKPVQKRVIILNYYGGYKSEETVKKLKKMYKSYQGLTVGYVDNTIKRFLDKEKK